MARPVAVGPSFLDAFLPQARRTLSYCMEVKWRLWNAVHVFILALTEHLLTKDSFFSSIYSLLWLPWYILYFKPVSVGVWPFSLGGKKGKFPEPNSLLFSKYGNFAYVKFPPPLSFYVGVLLFGKGSFHPTFCVDLATFSMILPLFWKVSLNCTHIGFVSIVTVIFKCDSCLLIFF